MLKIKKLIFSATIVSLLISAPVHAADSSGDSHRGKWIEFSDSQLEKMNSIKNQFLDKTAPERSELGILHRKLKDVLSQTEIDRSKAEGIQERINSIKSDLSNAKLNLKIDEIALLTPEQREQMHHHMLEAEAFGGRFRHHRHSGSKRFEHSAARQNKV